jgi:DNA-directed RNA polymerase specialized sigma24 family protein
MYLSIPFNGTEDLEQKINSSRGRGLKDEFGLFFLNLADYLKNIFKNLPRDYPGNWEDLAMEAFCHFYYYSQKNFKHLNTKFQWFFIVCVLNFVRSKYKGQKNQQTYVSLDDPGVPDNQTEVLIDRVTCADIIGFKMALDHFKTENPEAAMILQLLAYGYKDNDIIEILQISKSTFKRRKKIAREFLMFRISRKHIN